MKLRATLFALIAASFALSCGGGDGDDNDNSRAAISPLDGRDLEGREDFGPVGSYEELEKVSPLQDTDGDGLVDVDEIVGWQIRVDATARPQGIETRTVTSDPEVADTDQDGLPDGLERISGSDPNIADTDGDGLSDRDEVLRWGTSPVSVDTDADSRGDDPSAAPRVELFDGAELKLDANGNAAYDGTSPVLADTDGDGRSDFEELAIANRSGHIADVPKISVVPTPNTSLGIFFTTTQTTGSMMTEEFSTELTATQSNELSTTIGTTSTLSGWVSNSLDVGTSTTVEGSASGATSETTAYYEQRSAVGMRQEQSMRMSVDTETSAEWGVLAESISEFTRSKSRTISGGRITFATQIRNDGPITVRVRNLALSASLWSAATGTTRPVATMRPRQEPMEGYTLTAGESVDVIVEAQLATPELRRVLRNTSTFVISATGYEVIDAGDEQYTLTQSRVDERTSTILIEGPDGTESFKIATGSMRDADGNPIGLSVGEALTAKDLSYSSEPLDQPVNSQFDRVVSFGGGETQFHDGTAPAIDTKPYAKGNSPGDRQVRQGWVALIRRADGRTEVRPDMFDARIFPGDYVALVWGEDQDRDGVSHVEEAYAGTSDQDTDSDDDGLSDFWELRTRWRVQVQGQPVREVTSSPTSADTDGDGVSDFDEAYGAPNSEGLLSGTDPRSPDTDGDGLTDEEELADPNDDNDPLIPNVTTLAPQDCISNKYSANANAEPIQSFYQIVDSPLLITAVVVSFENGLVERFEHVPSNSVSRTLLYDSPALAMFGVDGFGNQTELTLCQTEVFQ